MCAEPVTHGKAFSKCMEHLEKKKNKNSFFFVHPWTCDLPSEISRFYFNKFKER